MITSVHPVEGTMRAIMRGRVATCTTPSCRAFVYGMAENATENAVWGVTQTTIDAMVDAVLEAAQ